jgi:hypothetical protein
VLSGKNASRVNEGTFDKQIGTLENTLGAGKYNLPQSVIDGIKSGKITDEELETTYGIKTELSQRLRNNIIAKDNFLDVITKSNIIYANENYDPSIETPVGADTKTGPNINEEEGRPENPGGGYDGSQNERPDDKQDNDNDGGAGQSPADRPDNSGGGGHTNPGKGSYGPHFARGGRAGYFFGGKV